MKNTGKKVKAFLVALSMVVVTLTNFSLFGNATQPEEASADNLVSNEINQLSTFVNPSIADSTAMDSTKTAKEWANKAFYLNKSICTVAEEGHGTAKALHLNCGESETYFSGGFLLELEPGSYDMSYWYKGSGLKTGHQFKLAGFDQYYDKIDEIPAGQFPKEAADVEWTQCSKTVQITGEKTRMVRFDIYGYAIYGDMLLSDFSVVKHAEPSKPTLPENDPDELLSSEVRSFAHFYLPETEGYAYPESGKTVTDYLNSATFANTGSRPQGASFALDSENKHGNTLNSLYFQSAPDGKSFMYSFFDVELEPGKYTLSYWYKGTDLCVAQGGYVTTYVREGKDAVRNALFLDADKYFTSVDNVKVPLTTEKATTDWQQCTKQVTISGDSAIIVRIEINGINVDGQIWLSDYSLKKVTDSGSEDPIYPSDPDELLSNDIIFFKYYYNPDTTSKPAVITDNESALNKAWYMWNGRFAPQNGGWGNTYVDTDTTHNGKPSLCYFGGDTADQGSGNYVYFTLRLDPGTYEYSYWTKYEDVWGKNARSVKLQTEIYSESFAQLDKDWPVDILATKKSSQSILSDIPSFDEQHISGDWKQNVKTIKVTGTEPLLVKIDFLVEDVGGTIWYSDFSLKKQVEPDDPLDPNDPVDPTNPNDPVDPDAPDGPNTSDESDAPDTGVLPLGPKALFALILAGGSVCTVFGFSKRKRLVKR